MWRSLPHPRVPRYTVRLRLTLLYGCVFLLCGTVLLGIAYFVARQAAHGPTFAVKFNGKNVSVKGPHGPVAYSLIHIAPGSHGGLGVVRETPPRHGGGSAPNRIIGGVRVSGGSSAAGPLAVFSAPGRRGSARATPVPTPAFPLAPPIALTQAYAQAEEQAKQLNVLGTEAHQEDLHVLLIALGIALAIMAVLSMVLGWLVAGRALRPLHTITRAARAISATNLHSRLALSGPHDELRELGDTFDDLLERLERSFAAQRQFVANASHELRTPLTLERAIIEVALADPGASAAELRETCERVLEIGDQQERMIEALLTLARGERGLDQSVIFDLKATVEEVVGSRGTAFAREGITLESRLETALASGDRRLVERLVANLLDNAICHNVSGGWVRLGTRLDAGEAVLAIENSGPHVAPELVERLFEPFTRLGADRSIHDDGHGLGLSIVAAIARAHQAQMSASARPDGGLAIEVRFPAVLPARAAALDRAHALPGQNTAQVS